VTIANSSGNQVRLGGITKAGNRYLRQMLVVGAMAVIRHAERNGARRPWLVQLLARTATKHAAIALANKTAHGTAAVAILKNHANYWGGWLAYFGHYLPWGVHRQNGGTRADYPERIGGVSLPAADLVALNAIPPTAAECGLRRRWANERRHFLIRSPHRRPQAAWRAR
jgi:hypothetical protein